MASVNLEDEMSSKAIKEKISNQMKDMNNPNNLYQGKIQDTLMDTHATEKVFDYSNIKSIIEHREVMQSKLMLSQQRVDESEVEKKTYTQILQSL